MGLKAVEILFAVFGAYLLIALVVNFWRRSSRTVGTPHA
jgi:hypothetical protein